MQIGKTVVLAVVASFFYVFMEWLFFITKHSVLAGLEFGDQLTVLFISFLFLVVVSIFFHFLVFFPVSIFSAKLGKIRLSLGLRCLVPGLLISLALFLLIDNFTYTFFGVASFGNINGMRFLYLPVYVALMLCSVRFLMIQMSDGSGIVNRKSFSGVASFLLVFGVVFFGVDAVVGRSIPSSAELDSISSAEAPDINVLFLFADGIDSSRMSLYGYNRETTPFLNSIESELLVFENHFTNAGKTTGSVGSLLSGKYPASTRVIYRPDIFTGVDSYEHLPGILKQYGYTNADFSVRFYVDPVDLNLLQGFDYANGRKLNSKSSPLSFINYYWPNTTHFLNQIYDRISGRILHSLNVRTMYNPYMMATNPSTYEYESLDRERIDGLKEFILKANGPFFAHVHLLGSHGPHFYSEAPRFAMEDQSVPWSKDHYDDAILQYDRYIEEVVALLKKEGLYENTLLVINSDHGFRWGVSSSLPLVFRFPDGEYQGVRKYNTQRIDIPHTVLGFLGIPIPDWMEGESLLDEGRNDMKPIYVVNRAQSSDVNGWRQIASPKPPFYTLGIISAIYCNKMFHLDVNHKFNLSVENINGHTGDCDSSKIPPPDEVYSGLLNHLEFRGYNTLSLQPKGM